MPLWRVALFLSAFLVFSVSLWAADAPVAISVSVVDEKDQPVGQAVVELRRDAKVLAASATDAAGQATLSSQVPGTFTMTVRKRGYVPEETVLETGAAGVEDIHIVLARAELSEQSIEVQDTASNPVAETVKAGATLSGQQAANQPTRPRTLTDALPLVPGIVRAPDGSVAIGGFGEQHSALLVNSVNVTDPATGEFGLSVPIDSVETLSVSQTPYLAQYGRFTAGVISAETRRGGEKWNFNVNDPLPEFRIRSGHLAGLKDASPRLNVSGPILADRLYFLEGAEYLLFKREVYTLPFPENQTKFAAVNSFSQVDAVISPHQTLTASLHLAPHTMDYAGLNFFNPQPVTPDARFHVGTAAIADRLEVGGGILQSTLATTRVTTGITPQGFSDMVLTPLGNQGNYFSDESRKSTRFEWIESWAPRPLHFHGEHLIQIGSVVAHSENEGLFNARPVLVQDAGQHLLQRIDFSGGAAFDVTDIASAAYAQDHWVLGSRVALDAGLRLEGQTITGTTRAAPRGGFIWSPAESHRTVIKGGVGVFYDSVPLDIYAFGSYPQQTITTYDARGRVAAVTPFINLTQQAAVSGFPFISREAQTGNFAPYNLAWNLEVERTINRWATVRFKYLQSMAHDVITIQPQVVDGQNAMVLGSSGAARSRQYEFTTRLGSSGPRQFYFSYVRQSARGDISDAATYLGNFPFPVVRQDLVASLPTEVPNRFLLWGMYSLPKKIALIPHLEFRNGFPFESTNVLQQYVPVESGPQPRFPRYFSANLRLSKELQMAQTHAVRLSLNVINLTNHFNALEVHSNFADPLYGQFFGNCGRRITVDFDFLH